MLMLMLMNSFLSPRESCNIVTTAEPRILSSTVANMSVFIVVVVCCMEHTVSR